MQTFKLLVDPRMLQILPLVAWSAVTLSVYQSLLIPILARAMQNSGDTHPELKSEASQYAKAFEAMTLIGVGELFGGMIIGNLKDRISNKCSLMTQILFIIGSIGAVLHFLIQNKFTIWAYIMCLTWGLQDSGLKCILFCLFGFEFESKIIPFCVYHFVESILVAAFQMVNAAVMSPELPHDQQSFYLALYLGFSGIFAILSVSWMFNFEYKSDMIDAMPKIEFEGTREGRDFPMRTLAKAELRVGKLGGKKSGSIAHGSINLDSINTHEDSRSGTIGALRL